MLKVARFVSLLTVALVAGAAFRHALEVPGSLELPAGSYLDARRALLGASGAMVGLELVALLSTLLVTWLVRRETSAMFLSLACVLSFTVAIVIRVGFVGPIDARIQAWTPDTMPLDWTWFRDRREFLEVTRALVVSIGLVAILLAALVDDRRGRRERDERAV